MAQKDGKNYEHISKLHGLVNRAVSKTRQIRLSPLVKIVFQTSIFSTMRLTMLSCCLF